MRELWELFSCFFKIGLFTFGGGYAMLPMLQREVVDRRGWIDEEEVLDIYAIGQCTPGVIAVNTATFVGYRRKGTLGASIATLGQVAPSLIIIAIIAALFENFAHYPLVVRALGGIRVAVAVLVVSSLIKLFRSGVKSAFAAAIFVAAFALSAFFDLSPILVVIMAVICGILLGKAGKKL